MFFPNEIHGKKNFVFLMTVFHDHTSPTSYLLYLYYLFMFCCFLGLCFILPLLSCLRAVERLLSLSLSFIATFLLMSISYPYCKQIFFKFLWFYFKFYESFLFQNILMPILKLYVAYVSPDSVSNTSICGGHKNN